MRLRPATAADEALLLAWANDPDVRRMARNQASIAAADHARWFAASLADPNRRIFIALADDAPAGQVRLDRTADAAEVDISVDRAARGRGVGRFLLTAPELEAWPGLRALWADVRRENAASAALFESAGFELETAGEAYLRFRRRAR